MNEDVPVVSAPALVVAEGQSPQAVLDPAKPATTTSEQDRQTRGQRRINVVWESTQAFTTVTVIMALIFAELHAIEATTLKNLALMIAATYYTRTNHTKVGGVESELRR